MFSVIFVFFLIAQSLFGAMSAGISRNSAAHLVAPVDALRAVMDMGFTDVLSPEEAQDTYADIVKPDGMSDDAAIKIMNNLGMPFYKAYKFLTYEQAERLLTEGKFLKGLHFIGKTPYMKEWLGVRRAVVKGGDPYFLVTTLKPTDKVVPRDIISVAARNCYVVGGFLGVDAKRTITPKEVPSYLDKLQPGGRGILIVNSKQIAIRNFVQKGSMLKFNRVVFFESGVPQSALFIAKKRLDEGSDMVEKTVGPRAPMKPQKTARPSFSNKEMSVMDVIRRVLRRTERTYKPRVEEMDQYKPVVATLAGKAEEAKELLGPFTNIPFYGVAVTHSKAEENFGKRAFLNGVIWVGGEVYPKDWEGLRKAPIGTSGDNILTLVLPKDPILTANEFRDLMQELHLSGALVVGFRPTFTEGQGLSAIINQKVQKGLVIVRPDRQIPLHNLSGKGLILKRFIMLYNEKTYSVVVAYKPDFLE